MKNLILVSAFACLFIGNIVSCKKEDDDTNDPGTGTTTSTTSTQSNPLVTKECSGEGEVTVDNTKSTMHATESLLPPLKLFAIYSSGETGSITMQTGENKLPASSRIYTVLGDPDKLPGSNQVILNYYNDKNQRSYYAVDGTVTYTISSTEKTLKFNNITFRTIDNEHSTSISYEVKLK